MIGLQRNRQDYVDLLVIQSTSSTLEVVEKIGRRVTVAGVRQTSRRSRTVKGELMLFLTVEDLHGTLEAILLPDVYQAARHQLDSTTPFLITGIMEMDSERGEAYMKVEQVIPLR